MATTRPDPGVSRTQFLQDCVDDSIGVLQERSIVKHDGKELRFFMTPLTCAERMEALAEAKGKDGDDFLINLLIKKACSSDGKPLLRASDRGLLLRRMRDSDLQKLEIVMLKEDEKTDMKSPEETVAS